MKATQLALFPLSAVTPPQQKEHPSPCQECLDYQPARSPFSKPLTFLPSQREELPFEQDGDDQ